MTQPIPSPFDPQQTLQKARKGALSVGEVHALSIHITGLERALRHRVDGQIAASRGEAVQVCLNEDASGLLVTFPGLREHAVSLPLSRPDLAMDFLVKALRERQGKPQNFIASPGAPTKADLEALARASKKQPKRVELVETLSLEDLDLSPFDSRDARARIGS